VYGFTAVFGLFAFLPWLLLFVAVSQSVSEIVLIDDGLVKMDAP